MADRKVPSFTPEEMAQIDAVKKNVLENPTPVIKPAPTPAPTPAPRMGGGMSTGPVHQIAPPMRVRPPLSETMSPDAEKKLGIKFEKGGLVTKPDEGQRVAIPVGRGELQVEPEYVPKGVMGGSASFEHPVGNRGTSLGAEGHFRKFHGDDRPEAGGRLFLRQKFEQGGVVEGPGCKFGSSTVVSCRNKDQ